MSYTQSLKIKIFTLVCTRTHHGFKELLYKDVLIINHGLQG